MALGKDKNGREACEAVLFLRDSTVLVEKTRCLLEPGKYPFKALFFKRRWVPHWLVEAHFWHGGVQNRGIAPLFLIRQGGLCSHHQRHIFHMGCASCLKGWHNQIRNLAPVCSPSPTTSKLTPPWFIYCFLCLVLFSQGGVIQLTIRYQIFCKRNWEGWVAPNTRKW